MLEIVDQRPVMIAIRCDCEGTFDLWALVGLDLWVFRAPEDGIFCFPRERQETRIRIRLKCLRYLRGTHTF